MKLRSILAIGLLTVFLVAACASATSNTPARSAVTDQPALQETAESALPTETSLNADPTQSLPAETSSAAPQVVATSRGPELESTDPATVKLASGELQLVEFFRFT